MAAEQELSFSDYVKAAFNWRTRVPLLGHLRLNWAALLALSVLGIANPGFWFLAAAGEMAFLTAVASSKRFQNVINAVHRLENESEEQDRVQTAVAQLEQESQRRYLRLLQQCREVLGISDALDGGGLDSVRRMRTSGLNQLLWIFLRLLTSREILIKTMQDTDRAKVEGELAKLTERLEREGDESTLGRSLRGTLDIQRKRLENYDRAVDNLKVAEAELDRIEQQVALVREETAVSGKAEVLSDRLDTVTGTLAETNRWMEQHAEVFSGLEGLEAPQSDVLPNLPPPLPEGEAQ